MKKVKLDLDMVKFIFAIKSYFGSENEETLETFKRYTHWYACEDRLEYGAVELSARDIKACLRFRFEEVLKAHSYPAGLYRSYVEYLDYFDLYATDAEKQLDAETYALLHTMLNLPVRNRIGGKLRCINGFTEKLITQAKRELKQESKLFLKANPELKETK